MPLEHDEEARYEGGDSLSREDDAVIQRSLSEESKEVLDGGRGKPKEQDKPPKLPVAAYNPDRAALRDAVKRLEDALAEQESGNKAVVAKLEDMLYEMREILDEINEIKQESQSVSHNARQAAIEGVNKAQHEAREITLKNIQETANKCSNSIDTMVDESKRRIERLAKITLPDTLFNYGKWFALLLVLVILCHIVWQLFV